MRERHRRHRFWIDNFLSNNVLETSETVDTSHASVVNVRAWNQGPSADTLTAYGYYGVPDMYCKLVEREVAFAPYGTGGMFHWPMATALHDGPNLLYAASYTPGNPTVTELFNGLNGAVSATIPISNPLIGQRNGGYWYGLGNGANMAIANFLYLRAAVKNALPCAITFGAFFTVSGEIFIDANPSLTEYILINYDLPNQRLVVSDSFGHLAVSANGTFPAGRWCSVTIHFLPGTVAFYNNGVSQGTAALVAGAFLVASGTAYFNRSAVANTFCFPVFAYNHNNLGQTYAQRHYEGSFFNFKVINSLYTTGSIAPFVAKTITINRLVDPGMPDILGLTATNANGIWYVDVQILNEV